MVVGKFFSDGWVEMNGKVVLVVGFYYIFFDWVEY